MSAFPSPTESQPSPPDAKETLSRWRLWAHLLLVLPLPLLAGLSGAGRHETHQSAMTESVKGLVWACFFNMALFGIVFGLAVWLSRSTRDDLLLRVRRPVLTIFAGLSYSVLIRVGILIVAVLAMTIIVASGMSTMEKVQAFAVANRPDVETVVSLHALKSNPAYYWMMLTVVSFIVAGLREELWRTGSLAALARLWPRLFASEAGQLGAVAVSSIFFGLGHAPMGALAVAATTVIGFFLGTIMVLHKSIWPAVIAHGMFDATSFALIDIFGDAIKAMH